MDPNNHAKYPPINYGIQTTHNILHDTAMDIRILCRKKHLYERNEKEVVFNLKEKRIVFFESLKLSLTLIENQLRTHMYG